MRKLFSCLIILLILFSCKQKLENHFFTPGELWPDNKGVHINAHGGGILFHNGVYYWYGEHKIAGEIGNSAQVGVHCYSSTDLYNWKDEGIALKVVENDSTQHLAKGCIIERPKVIFNSKTNKFVMWFHLELLGKEYSAARSGIALSDNAAGPYTYLKSVRPDSGFWPVNVQPFHSKPVRANMKSWYPGGKGYLPDHPDSLNLLGRDFKKGQMARDMNLFVDDDGSAYQIYTSEENSTLHISKLTDDYLGYSGKYIRLFPDRYNEGPTLFKHNGKYYIISSDCTSWRPNAARSAIADSIFGNWTELGNFCIGADSALTFRSQSTYILQVAGKKDAFIFMGDRWTPENAIDGRYIWLPLLFEKDKLVMKWMDKWNLEVFSKK